MNESCWDERVLRGQSKGPKGPFVFAETARLAGLKLQDQME